MVRIVISAQDRKRLSALENLSGTLIASFPHADAYARAVADAYDVLVKREYSSLNDSAFDFQSPPTAVRRHVSNSSFGDGESLFGLDDTTRKHTVYLVQQVEPPRYTEEAVEEFFSLPPEKRRKALLELYYAPYATDAAITQMSHGVDALTRDGVDSIWPILPYFPNSRQSQKFGGRQAITAASTLRQIDGPKVEGFLSIDLHASPIEGFLDKPFIHLNSDRLWVDYIREHHPDLSSIVLSPVDGGGQKRVDRYAKWLGAEALSVLKNRSYTDGGTELRGMSSGADLEGKTALIVDDMVASGGSVEKVDDQVKARGAVATEVYACHGLFSNKDRGLSPVNAMDSLAERDITVHVLDTVIIPEDFRKRYRKHLVVEPSAGIIGRAIFNLTQRQSLSKDPRLFIQE